MNDSSLSPNRQAAHLKRISNFLFTALLLVVFIFVLSYFFHTGAELVAEIVVKV